MFVRSPKGGRTAALLISGLLAALFLTGSASPRTTYHITDSETVYTVTGQPDDTEGALALAGVEISERDRVTSALQADGSVAITVERPVTTYEELIVDLLPYDTLEDCYRALDNYFQSMLAMAASPCYDVVGHVIYPLRYMNGPYDTPSLDRYRDQIREILRLAIQSGRGIEINTWKGQTLREWIPILRDYRELGGEILTVGSDAHAPEPLGRGIREAYGLMADCGFRYVAVYHARKPEMIRLK